MRTAVSPVGRQRWPLPLVRILTTDLHAPSVTPLPTGMPTARRRAYRISDALFSR